MAAASAEDEAHEDKNNTKTVQEASPTKRIAPHLGSSSEVPRLASHCEAVCEASVGVPPSPSESDGPLGFTFGAGSQLPLPPLPEKESSAELAEECQDPSIENKLLSTGSTRAESPPKDEEKLESTGRFGESTPLEVPLTLESTPSKQVRSHKKPLTGPIKVVKAPVKGDIKLIKALPEAPPAKVVDTTPRLGGGDNDSEHSLEFTFGTSNNQDMPVAQSSSTPRMEPTLDVIHDGVESRRASREHESRPSSMEESTLAVKDDDRGARPSTPPVSSITYNPSPRGSPVQSAPSVGVMLPKPPLPPKTADARVNSPAEALALSQRPATAPEQAPQAKAAIAAAAAAIDRAAAAAYQSSDAAATPPATASAAQQIPIPAPQAMDYDYGNHYSSNTAPGAQQLAIPAPQAMDYDYGNHYSSNTAPGAQQVAIPAPQAMDYGNPYSSKIAHDAYYNGHQQLMLPMPPATMAHPGIGDVSVSSGGNPATLPYGPYFLQGHPGTGPAPGSATLDCEAPSTVKRKPTRAWMGYVPRIAVAAFVAALFAGLAACIILYAGDLRS